jgi:two-component system CheB/CheR fusion protein
MASLSNDALAAAAAGPFDERLFRSHFQNLPKPAYIWQRIPADFRLVAHNEAASRFAGDEVPRLIGIRASVLHAQRPDAIANMNRCVEEGLVISTESDFVFLSGELHTLIAIHIPLGSDILVTHIEDVTEARAAEQALKESESRTRALFHCNPDVTYRMDERCNYVDIYISETTPFPFTREQLLGRNVRDFYDAKIAAEHQRCVTAAIETGEIQIWEFSLPINEIEVHLELRFVRSGDNEVVVSVRDVSERLRLERSLIEATERERNRIGQDLHDGLAQILTGTKLLLSSLKTRLRTSHPALAATAQQAVKLIDSTIVQTRELAQGLSPVIPGETLAVGLQQLARQSSKFFFVSCRAECTCTQPLAVLDETTSTHLYRIAQEAVTNAVRHGRATQVTVSCAVAERRLHLQIQDNGTGISDPPPKGDGLGIRIMRHRARTIGGELAIARMPQGGTLISCSCPLPR